MQPATREEKLALLEETVDYYSQDPENRRAVNGGCQYATKDGRQCAVGRLLPFEVARALTLELEKKLSDTDVVAVWDYLPQNVRRFGQSFLLKLQLIHDGHSYWKPDGFNFRMNAVNLLKNDINVGLHDNDIVI